MNTTKAINAIQSAKESWNFSLMLKLYKKAIKDIEKMGGGIR